MTQNLSPKAVLRAQARAAFLHQYYNAVPEQVSALDGDASFRRYFRITHEQSRIILLDVAPEVGNVQAFVELNALFSKGAVRVPQIMAADCALGFVLLEDLGTEHLADRLDAYQDALGYYETLIEMLPDIARLPESPHMKPYDAAFIDMELDIFSEWLLTHWLGYETNEIWLEQWCALKETLTSAMLEQTQVTMHRDFHSRNIMWHKQQWVVIDYQDAVQGPACYDAVSLLKDCYHTLPEDQFEHLQRYSFDVLNKAGLLASKCYTDYQQQFALTGLQRHLKAAGIFARLYLRDGKPGYLQNILPTLQYIYDAAKCVDTFQWLATCVQSEIIPLVKAKLEQCK
ncbi:MULTISPECIES: phosphotransferase [unclassified Pseudoalteromonas]|uniref:aminoglycoside phosphotransferase family protein n=1 Tax=unclassified Pseudoalteromonas TaxID=194690 RepID=UPI00209840EF|nr:phosphotransferase [Pseudoalteromonas sp. XMcav2-N]MCO7186890.1 phosphotransferase [Pseudoalteromonas sp. XMcav2-N]